MPVIDPEDRKRELEERDHLAKAAAAWKMNALRALGIVPPQRVYSGHPKRDEVIGKEDICDLKIALGTTRDVNEFLKIVQAL
jgi:hypothetical protein